MVATVKYQIATYSGETTVHCDMDEADHWIIERAKTRLRRECGGYLPYGYQSFTVTSRSNNYEN